MTWQMVEVRERQWWFIYGWVKSRPWEPTY